MLNQRPLLLPVLAMVAGLIINDQTGYSAPLSLVIASAAVLFLSSFITSKKIFSVSLALFFTIWGCHTLSLWTNPVYRSNSVRYAISDSTVLIEGVITSRPSVSDGRTSFILNSEHLVIGNNLQPVSGKLMVYLSSGDCAVARGDRIRFAARLSKPRLLGLPGEFDYPRYLKLKSVAATAQISDSNRLILIRGRVHYRILRKFDDMAASLKTFICSSETDPRVSSVLVAVLLGDQKQIPRELTNAYTRAGVNHILSVSGFHVGILSYGMALLLLLLMTRSSFLALHLNLRRLVFVLPLPTMFAYLFITGTEPATARSVIMLTIVVLACYVERETDGINTLLMAAFALLLINPPTLFEISFQLSFLALWGIILINRPVLAWSSRFEQRWIRQLLVFIAASFAASAFTVIPVLFVFKQASLNGLFANFIIVPLLGYGATLIGFTGLICSYLYSPLAILFLTVAGWLTHCSNIMVTFFASLPVLHYHSLVALDMGLFLCWICAATFISANRVRLTACILIPVVAAGSYVANVSENPGTLRITMLSVGQGESLLLRLPGGEKYLVDGGGYLHENGKDFGERVLVPALLKLGINKLDGLILTHSHPDHLGGFPFLTETMPVSAVFETAVDGGDDNYLRFHTAIKQKHISHQLLSAGKKITISPGVQLQVVSPPENRLNDLHNDRNMNERSLVFRLVYKKFSMLFTADAGFEAESELLTAGVALKSTVLKVGHHGSRYSTSEQFLKKVSPEIALISAGYGNRFGLPAEDTTQLLQNNGVRIYRTDNDGTVEIESDGEVTTVDTPYKTILQHE